MPKTISLIVVMHAKYVRSMVELMIVCLLEFVRWITFNFLIDAPYRKIEFYLPLKIMLLSKIIQQYV